jgi:hypothetical protein
MGSDDTLFAWTRYYASFILLCAVLGVFAGVIAVSVSPDVVAASTLVVQAGDSIRPRQLGPVAITVFRSEAVVGAAARALPGADSSTVEEGTELLPLPDAPALIVLGQARGYEEAGRLSETAAEALVEALNRQVGTEEFRIFSGPQGSFVPGDRSTGVSVAIGAATGFWLGLSFVVLHYRWKRPVLTLHRALSLSGADQLAIHRARGWTWLGFLRDRIPRRELTRNEVRLAWLRTPSEQLSSATARRDGRGARVSAGPSPTGPSNGEEVLVITARPGTEEKAIASSRLMVGGADADRAGRIGLVWVR